MSRLEDLYEMRCFMKVYLKEDIERVGMKKEIIDVNDGFANNYLIPRKLAVAVTPQNEAFYTSMAKVINHRKEVIATQTSMLAEKIGSLEIKIKRKMHDDGKLYGSLNALEIAEALQQQGVNVAKSQVIIDKSIKEKGHHSVTIKLTSRLQPKLKVHVLPE